MIPRTYGRIGEPVCFKGTACDFGHTIAAIQFSLDGGENWTTYPTPGTNDYQNVVGCRYIPKKAGLHVLKVRSVNDEGEESPEADSQSFLWSREERWERS